MASSILTTFELDYIIQNAKVSKLEDVGSADWYKERDKLCKLYQVSVLEAENPPCEERVKSSLVTYGTINIFVKELITLTVWRLKILPELCKLSPKPEQAMPTYIILYSEQLLVCILETALFYEELFWDLGDSSFDIIEYATSQLILLDTKAAFSVKEVCLTDTNVLKVIIDFSVHLNCCISVSSLSMLRFVVENLDKLPLSAASKVYSAQDLPLIIAHFLDKDVWTVKEGGKTYKFVDSKWKEWLPSDPLLSKVECQTWLLLRQLLLNSTIDTVYKLTNNRKQVLSKLLRLLHERVVDQLSPLVELKDWLQRLSFVAPQESVHNPLIFEVNSGYKDILLQEYRGKWNQVALSVANFLFYPKKSDLVNIVKGFADGLDGMVDVAESLNKCSVCFSKAIKRCSKCRKVWYCSRKCQVNNWGSHKLYCNK